MSPNSSISASDRGARRFLAIVGAVVAALLLLNMALSLHAIRNNLLSWHFAYLFEYQTGKLKSGPAIEILLVGDSSLGNAIDAPAWKRASGHEVVNAALTGAYGYGGSLQMLRRAADARGVKSAIIVHTPQILMRANAHDGYLFSAATLSSALDVPLGDLLPWLLSLDIPISMLKKLVPGSPADAADLKSLDFVRQGEAESTRAEFHRLQPLDPTKINAEHMHYLRLIAKFCRENQIRCVYGHGPIAAPLCSDAKGYYSTINAAIRMAGLRLLAEAPVCLAKEELGDQFDHVAPSKRAWISEIYRSRYSAWLEREGQRSESPTEPR